MHLQFKESSLIWGKNINEKRFKGPIEKRSLWRGWSLHERKIVFILKNWIIVTALHWSLRKNCMYYQYVLLDIKKVTPILFTCHKIHFHQILYYLTSSSHYQLKYSFDLPGSSSGPPANVQYVRYWWLENVTTTKKSRH